MDFNPLFDRLWGADGVHPFGDPYKFDEYMTGEIEYEKLDEEICEYLKGDFKTTIICKFNKQGYLVSHTAESIDISEPRAIMEQTRTELFKALDEDRFEDAKICQDKINQLRQILELRKPTL